MSADVRGSPDAYDDMEENDVRGRPPSDAPGGVAFRNMLPAPLPIILLFVCRSPKLSAVLPFACVYVYALSARARGPVGAPPLEVHALRRGGGFRDGLPADARNVAEACFPLKSVPTSIPFAKIGGLLWL